MSRILTDHKLTGLNEAIVITALDEPGAGGANHRYAIDVIGGAPSSGGMTTEIKFQNGPVGEAGFNGISNESLIAIVIDRMRGFQGEQPVHAPIEAATRVGMHEEQKKRAPFSCRENAITLTKLEEALFWLKKRTNDRLARGVEGKNVA